MDYAIHQSSQKPIAVYVGCSGLGDTIASIPTIRKIVQAYNNLPVTLFTYRPEIFENHPLVYQSLHVNDWKWSGEINFGYDINQPGNVYYTYKTFESIAGRSHSLSNDQKIEFKYPDFDIRQFHAVSLGFQLKTNEMATDLYIEKERDLGFNDYVIIHPSNTRPMRSWPQNKWQELVDRLNDNNIPVIAVGQSQADKPIFDINIKYGYNLLDDDHNDIAELRWMMQYKARAIITMDSGMLHIAGTTDVPIIQLDSSIDPQLRAPIRYGSQEWNYYLVKNKCEYCASNLKFSVIEHGNIHGVPPISEKCMFNEGYEKCEPTVDQVFNQTTNLYKVNAKVRLVHLLLEDDIDPQRQDRSIESLSKLENFGIEYIQVWNEKWKSTPPKESFTRPEKFDQIPIKPEHYGAFRSFADSTIDYFTEDIDYFIICEGDCLLTLSPQEAVDKINESIKGIETHNISYFSFGSRYSLEANILQSQTREKYGDIHIVDNIIGLQMIMFPQNIRNYLIDKFKYATWDCADIFLTDIFVNKFRMGMLEQPISTQASGISNIDKEKKIFNNMQENNNQRKKLLFIAPHLSTGGMPQFLTNRIEAFQNSEEFEVYVIEFSKYADKYVVQRNKLKNLLDKDHFISCSEDYSQEESDMDRSGIMLGKIMDINPDIIHIEECPESFDDFNQVRKNILKAIYDKGAPWKIIESCHNICTTWEDKIYKPDGFMFVTPYHQSYNFNDDSVPYNEVIQSPFYNNQPNSQQKLEAKEKLGLDQNKTHVLNVGLWTPLKNQKELIDIAKKLEDKNFVFHFVGNNASNFESYWKPILNELPNNVQVWGESSDVEKFYNACDVFSFHSIQECNPLAIKEAINHGLKVIVKPLRFYENLYDPFINYYSQFQDIDQQAKELVEIIQNDNNSVPNETKETKFEDFRLQHENFYNQILNRDKVHKVMKNEIMEEKFVVYHSREGFFLHCYNLDENSHYRAEFKAPDHFNQYQNVFTPNSLESNKWYSPLITYHLPWNVKVFKDDNVIYEYNHTLDNTNVVVVINTDSFGDNLAFVGQLINFKKEHNINQMTVSTNKHHLFDKEEYEKFDIHFVPLGSSINYTPDHVYELGVYYNSQNAEEYNKPNHHKYDWRQQPLPKIAADILGINYYETKPILNKEFRNAKPTDKDGFNFNNNIVTFGTESTAQAKHWNYPQGWEILASKYKDNGFNVYNLQWKEPLNNANNIKSDLKDCCAFINYSHHFVGLPSGMSWLAWALDKPVILISGFTHKDVEFKDKCWRVINKNVCNNCWGRYAFDASDWNWCPEHKGTFRQFECTKTISPDFVWLHSSDIINQYKNMNYE